MEVFNLIVFIIECPCNLHEGCNLNMEQGMQTPYTFPSCCETLFIKNLYVISSDDNKEHECEDFLVKEILLNVSEVFEETLNTVLFTSCSFHDLMTCEEGVALVSGQCNQNKIQQCLNDDRGAFSDATDQIFEIYKLCSKSTTTAFSCFKNEANKCSSNEASKTISLVNRITVTEGSKDKLFSQYCLHFFRETTITAFACFKNEMNKCSSSLSFTVTEQLSLLNRITVEGLQKACNTLNLKKGSIECFNRAIRKSRPSYEACLKSDKAFTEANLSLSMHICRGLNVAHTCGLDYARNDCSTPVDDFGSLIDTMRTLFACDNSGATTVSLKALSTSSESSMSRNFAGNGFSRCNSAPVYLLGVIGALVTVPVGW